MTYTESFPPVKGKESVTTVMNSNMLGLLTREAARHRVSRSSYWCWFQAGLDKAPLRITEDDVWWRIVNALPQ